MEKYNLDKLIKLQYNDYYPSRDIRYQKEYKFLGFIIRKEGFYSKYFSSYISEELPKNHTFKNGVVYENPEVILYYQEKYSKTYYFDSPNDAKKFFDKITAIGRWL